MKQILQKALDYIEAGRVSCEFLIYDNDMKSITAFTLPSGVQFNSLCQLGKIESKACPFTEEEAKQYNEYLEANLPRTKGSYSWEVCDKEPRVKWLKEQIEKL